VQEAAPEESEVRELFVDGSAALART